ncbi:hypothetical protein [uncultured Alteromonas sp.]|uniref:hypothetical protein n=1 Tax=uncultured Alteromonas sp. TaxID=179113 RepID=UPI0030EE7B72|tara:strand:- start:1538 stop:2068 length:531 start_codon:yes stop_codon:yes gene_type:complete
MSDVDWSRAPEWADRLMKSQDGDMFWCNDKMYLLADGEGSSYVRLLSDNESDIAYSIGSFKLIETRPDAWKEGEERMNVIPQNGNDGEHYKSDVIEHDNNNKYSRKIKTIVVDGIDHDIYVDVYDVLTAFNVINPATAHAVKKELMPGKRGAKGVIQDLTEARDSLNRAIEIEKNK